MVWAALGSALTLLSSQLCVLERDASLFLCQEQGRGHMPEGKGGHGGRHPLSQGQVEVAEMRRKSWRITWKKPGE